MIAVTVIDNDGVREKLEKHLHPVGIDFVHYTNPLKAMDNLVEISPALVFFSAQDFPRHWKSYISMLRGLKPYDNSVFVLLTGSEFSIDEVTKATSLDVAGIFSEVLNSSELELVLELLKRYNLVMDHRMNRRYSPKEFDTIKLILTHPKTMKFVFGVVQDLDAQGIAFHPDELPSTVDLINGDRIPVASLLLEDDVLFPSLQVTRNNKILALKFDGLSDKDNTTIREFIEHYSQRALRIQTSGL